MSEFHRVIFRRAWFSGRFPTVLRTASVIFAKRIVLPDLLTSDDVMVVNSLVERVVSSAPSTLDSQLPSTWIIFTDLTAKSTCQSGALGSSCHTQSPSWASLRQWRESRSRLLAFPVRIRRNADSQKGS